MKKFIPKQLYGAFIIDTTDFGGFHFFDKRFGFFFSINIRQCLAQEYGEIGFSINCGGINIVEDKLKRAINSSFFKLVGDVVGIEFDFGVGFVLIRVEMIGVVFWLVIDNFLKDYFCRVYARSNDDIFKLYILGNHDKINHLEFSMSNSPGIFMISYK